MEIDELIRSTLEGDLEARRVLLAQVTPQLQQLAAAHAGLRGRSLGAREDTLAEVVTTALARLSKGEYRNLARYLEQRELSKPQSFDSWLYGTVDFTVREHLRERFGRAPGTEARQAGPSKRDVNTQAERVDEDLLRASIGKSLALTNRLELAKIGEYMQANFTENELLAMRLHYAADKSAGEIAHALGLAEEGEAVKLIRRLNARLRHHFVES